MLKWFGALAAAVLLVYKLLYLFGGVGGLACQLYVCGLKRNFDGKLENQAEGRKINARRTGSTNELLRASKDTKVQ